MLVILSKGAGLLERKREKLFFPISSKRTLMNFGYKVLYIVTSLK